jgi:hypothetical protein
LLTKTIKIFPQGVPGLFAHPTSLLTKTIKIFPQGVPDLFAHPTSLPQTAVLESNEN